MLNWHIGPSVQHIQRSFDLHENIPYYGAMIIPWFSEVIKSKLEPLVEKFKMAASQLWVVSDQNRFTPGPRPSVRTKCGGQSQYSFLNPPQEFGLGSDSLLTYDL